MKKNIRLCLILLCLTLLVSLTGLAQTEETIYYAAPHDTASYHVDPACPLIPSQDRDSLLTLTPEALSEAPYQTLLPCTLCFGQLEGNALEEMARINPFVYRSRSAYDTAKNSTLIAQAGAYLAGRDMDPGIYTIEADARCAGEARVLTCDGEALYAYALEGEALCSLYLGEGMTVELPANCRMRRVRYNPVLRISGRSSPSPTAASSHGWNCPPMIISLRTSPARRRTSSYPPSGLKRGKKRLYAPRSGRTTPYHWSCGDKTTGLSSSSTVLYGPPKSA